MQEVARSDAHVLTSIAFAADGSLLALCAASGEVLRCDVQTGRLHVACVCDRAAVGLAVDVATASPQRGTRLWLAHHGEPCVGYVTLPSSSSSSNDDDDNDDDGDSNKHKQQQRQSSSLPTAHGHDNKTTSWSSSAAAPRCAMTPLVSSVDGRALRGPTALAVCPVTRALFFTDAGGEGDASLASPVGAVYRTLHTPASANALPSSPPVVLPLCAHGLCQPSGIAVGRDGCVFVCEQAANRVLRFVRRGSYYVGGVFAHLHGSLGPSAVAVSPRDGSVYVAMYEPSELAAGDAYAPRSPHPAASHDDDDDNNNVDNNNDNNDNNNDDDDTTGAAAGSVYVFARDGTERGVVVTPASQLRAIAVDVAGAYVYMVHADEASCTSIIYRCPTCA